MNLVFSEVTVNAVSKQIISDTYYVPKNPLGKNREERVEKNIKFLKIGESGRISRIDGPSLRERMKKIGIREGMFVERLGLTSPPGCVEIKIGRRKITLGLGVTMKLRLNQGGKTLGLLEMKAHSRGVVSVIQGGKRIVEILKKNFGIETGKVIELVGWKPDREFLVEVEGRQASICEGDASKILVRKGKTIQLNYLKEGDKAPIVVIAAGLQARSMLHDYGIEEGRVIRLVQAAQSNFKEPELPLVLKTDDQKVSIGFGMAEKIWVEEMNKA